MKMTAVPTNDLEGPALDWAVAKAQGLDVRVTGKTVWVRGPLPGQYVATRPSDDYYTPSTQWNQGGPLLDQEGIGVLAPEQSLAGVWQASYIHPDCSEYGGTTPLIAVCKSLVARKLGDEVEIPADLMP